jgi:hypothetical protein
MVLNYGTIEQEVRQNRDEDRHNRDERSRDVQ